jgi:phosphoribosylformimino-5-aminoimidazole carboxamide ribotide isomerase
MMKPFDIIPAIDLIDGKCVRLSQGDYNKKTIYNQNPLEVALAFEDIGIRRLHLVDLDGAKKGEVVNLKVLENIASKTKLSIDFGGGIKNDASIQSVFNSGAAMATIGSIAVKQPELFFSWISTYGSDKIFLGADVKDEMITVSGWLENTNVNIIDFLKTNISKGLTKAFCTDVSKDGMLEGPSINLYKKIISEFPDLYFVASGGVSNLQDVIELQNIKCNGVIIGKAIYENKIRLEDLRKWHKEE